MTTIQPSRRTFAAVLLGAATFAAGAPAAHADRTLSLDDALAAARDHNRDLRVARARLAESEVSIETARAALLPSVTAQGKYTHNYKGVDLDLAEFNASSVGLAQTIQGSSGNAAENKALDAYQTQLAAVTAAQPPIVIQKQEELDFALTATVPLLAPGNLYALRAAKLGVRASAASYAVSEASVLVAVAQAFYLAAGTDEILVARQHAVEVAKTTFEHAQARVAADVANKVDVTRAEAALVRAQQNQLEADTARRAAYRALATLIDVHDVTHVQPATSPAAPAITLDQQVAHALQARPELLADRASIDAASANVSAGQWRWSPTLSAFGNVRAFNYTGFSGDRYSWAIGLEADWLLYDGGARDAQRHLAEAQRRESEAQLELATDAISDEVANARDTLDTKQHAVAAAERDVTLAQETVRITTAQYEAGTTQQLDLLQAQDALVDAEVTAARSHFDAALAELQLRRADGTFPAQGASR